MKSWLFLFFTFAAALSSGAEENLDFSEAGRMAIQSGGRKKPLETFAAETLQAITGRRTFADSQTGKNLSAMDTLFSIWFTTRDWRELPVILVPNAALRKELGLSAVEKRFSLKDLEKNHALSAFRVKIQTHYAANEDLLPLEKEAETILGRMSLLEDLEGGGIMTIIPNPTASKGDWHAPRQAVEILGEKAGGGIVTALKQVESAYRSRDPGAFPESCRTLRRTLAEIGPSSYPSEAVLGREIHYNHLHPFRWAWVLYLVAFFFLTAKRTHPMGFWIFSAGLGLQIYGVILRCWIAGRPPVSNMYESVVWVSLGVAAFAFIFELIYRSRVYALAAAPISILGLILADMLPSVLDPGIRPLPPVLRDNFWLITHVLSITLGYAAFALAMGLGHFMLGRYLFKPASMSDQSPLHHLLYRVLQMGIFLLAVGVILGGVWANYSWGRFWGWDPKETWALIALLLYIFAVHGRVARWWGNFGLNVASVVCFNGVLMAWYGVNFVLGKGLHSYGFGGGGFGWMGGIVALDLLFVGICMGARLRRSRFSPRANQNPDSRPSAAAAL